jgi:two-component system response regulator DevR
VRRDLPVVVSSPTRVLLVDDHQLLTDSLARLLTAEPDIEVVGIAASVAETRRQTSPRVDVALMDYRLPGS